FRRVLFRSPTADHAGGDLLAVEFAQLGLVVKQIDVRRCAILQQEDDAFGLGGVVAAGFLATQQGIEGDAADVAAAESEAGKTRGAVAKQRASRLVLRVLQDRVHGRVSNSSRLSMIDAITVKAASCSLSVLVSATDSSTWSSLLAAVGWLAKCSVLCSRRACSTPSSFVVGLLAVAVRNSHVMRVAGSLPACHARVAKPRADSTKPVSLSVVSACSGVLVIERLTTQACRACVSNSTVGPTIRRQNTYRLRR